MGREAALLPNRDGEECIVFSYLCTTWVAKVQFVAHSSESGKVISTTYVIPKREDKRKPLPWLDRVPLRECDAISSVKRRGTRFRFPGDRHSRCRALHHLKECSVSCAALTAATPICGIIGQISDKENSMAKKSVSGNHPTINAQPRFHQKAAEIQPYGTVTLGLPLDLEEPVRLEMTEQLNQLLADTMALRDLYKKSHWQVAGPTFYQLHLLYDKHYGEQVELVDTIAERIQILGGVSIAMAADVAETTRIERPPRGREEVPVQLSRLLDAHQVIIGHCRRLSERASKIGDEGTNDMVVSDVLRTNELEVWFISQHLVNEPLVEAIAPQGGRKSSAA